MKTYYIMPKWASKMYLKRTKRNKYLINAYSRITADFLDMVKLYEIEWVVDVGTGPGALPLTLVKKNSKIKITGIDISPSMVDIAIKNVREEGYAERINFKKANVIELPFKDNTVSAIISTFSLHEWPEPEKGIYEMLRILKPSGKLVIYDIHPNLSNQLKEELKSQYGCFYLKYFKHLSKSSRKTMDMIEPFLNSATDTYHYVFTSLKDLMRIKFEK